MISVVLDDLAFVPADAILRPTDDRLAPVTPAVSRLDRQGGPDFTKHLVTRTALARGSAVVTGAGDLAAPLVVHVVVQDAEGMPARHELRRALDAAWHQAREWGLRHMAAPLVGTGAGQLATEEAAALMVESFEAQRRPGQMPVDLTVVVEQADDLAAVSALLGRRP